MPNTLSFYDLMRPRGCGRQPGQFTLVGNGRLDQVGAVDFQTTSGRTVLAAYATLNSEEGSDDFHAPEVLAWLRTVLPAQIVPARLYIVSDIPKTLRGKIDRAALRVLATTPIGAV